jgi:hypothetical protein
MTRLHRLSSVILLAAWLAACASPSPSPRPAATRSATATILPRAATGSAAAIIAGTPKPSEAPREITPTATALPVPISLYPPDCVEAQKVTLRDVGHSLCVGGLVFNATVVHGDMYIAFGSDQGAFYMVGYDWSGARGFNQGDCVYGTAPVENLGSVPVMRIDSKSLHACSLPEYPTPTPPANLPSGCRFALDITAGDYGKTMCAGGTVAYVSAHENAHEVYFSLVLSMGLHFVIYGMGDKDRAIRPGDCVFANTHKVDKVGSILVMNVPPADLQRCPEAPKK